MEISSPLIGKEEFIMSKKRKSLNKTLENEVVRQIEEMKDDTLTSKDLEMRTKSVEQLMKGINDSKRNNVEKRKQNISLIMGLISSGILIWANVYNYNKEEFGIMTKTFGRDGQRKLGNILDRIKF